jgi:hypothetical protein
LNDPNRQFGPSEKSDADLGRGHLHAYPTIIGLCHIAGASFGLSACIQAARSATSGRLRYEGIQRASFNLGAHATRFAIDEFERVSLLEELLKLLNDCPLYGTVELKSPFSDRLALLEDGTLMQLVDDNEFRADARVPKAQFS